MTVRDYYETLWGMPDRTALFSTHDDRQFYVHKFGLENNPEEVAIYATDGAHLLPGSYSEYFIGIRPEADEIANAIAEAALHGSGTETSPRFGDTITLSFPLWERTEISTFMFSNGEGIVPSKQIDGVYVRFTKLVPLFRSELEYKRSFGEEALWGRFRDLKVAFWEKTRGPAF